MAYQGNLLGKTLVIGIIILFVIMSINPTIGKSIIRISKKDDTTPPVTTYTLDPPKPDGLNGWYVSDATVALNATDNMSGVKEIRYTINGWSEHISLGIMVHLFFLEMVKIFSSNTGLLIMLVMLNQ